jgi:penicillin-binding protein 2
MQVELADYYRSKIRISSEVTVRVPSARGEIRDRNGVPLATNHFSYEVDFYLPDIVNAYEEKHGKSPSMQVRSRDQHGMLHDRETADIVKIVDQDITPRLRTLGLAVPYDSGKLQSHFRTSQAGL